MLQTRFSDIRLALTEINKPFGFRLALPTARLAAVLILGATVISGCVSTPEVKSMASVSVLHESNNCGIQDPGLSVLRTTAQWDRLREALYRANPLGSPPVIKAVADDDIAVLVTWGQKPNASYGLSLQSRAATAVDDSLVLPVAFNEPAAGMVSAQVLVSPCLVLAVSGTADYKWLRAGDMVAEIHQ